MGLNLVGFGSFLLFRSPDLCLDRIRLLRWVQYWNIL
jgi:hypothetical protein